MDLQAYGSARPLEWTHELLVKLLGTGNRPLVTDPLLLNAFRSIDRRDFTPSEQQHIAYTDRNVPLEYNEIMTNPTTVARMLQLLRPELGGRYLELGAGTGYMTALIAYLAGASGRVYGLERVQWLWERARENMRKYPQLKSAEVLYRDGTAGLADHGPYDGIILSYVTDELHPSLREQLSIGGKLLAPTDEHTLRMIERTGDDAYLEEIVPDYNKYAFGTAKLGLA